MEPSWLHFPLYKWQTRVIAELFVFFKIHLLFSNNLYRFVCIFLCILHILIVLRNLLPKQQDPEQPEMHPPESASAA